MTIRRVAVWIAFAVLAATAAFVRLAPVDPGRWHVDLTGLAAELAEQPVGEVRLGRNSAAVMLSGGEAALTNTLEALDRVALASPRTNRIAGSPADGWVTWQSRSLVWGFPDYTTAQIVDGSLVLLARPRFGGGDWGVNAARLTEWLSQL